MYADMPDEIASENLEKLMYGDTPAGRSIAGDIPTVQKMSRKDFVSYHRKFYTAENTVIVVSGGIDEKIIPIIKQAFAGVVKKAKNKKPKTSDKQSGRGIMIHKKSTQQTHLAIGFRGYDMYHDDEITASVLASVLGSGMSSSFVRIPNEPSLVRRRWMVRRVDTSMIAGYSPTVTTQSSDRLIAV